VGIVDACAKNVTAVSYLYDSNGLSTKFHFPTSFKFLVWLGALIAMLFGGAEEKKDVRFERQQFPWGQR